MDNSTHDGVWLWKLTMLQLYVFFLFFIKDLFKLYLTEDF